MLLRDRIALILNKIKLRKSPASYKTMFLETAQDLEMCTIDLAGSEKVIAKLQADIQSYQEHGVSVQEFVEIEEALGEKPEVATLEPEVKKSRRTRRKSK